MSTTGMGGSGETAGNAWTRPLQRTANADRSDSIVPPPGMGSQLIELASELVMGDSAPRNGIGHQSALRERFLQLALSMVGQRLTITRTDGVVIEGVLHTFTPFVAHPPDVRNRYVVKACKVSEGKVENFVDGSTIVIRAESVSSVHVKSMRLDKVSNNGIPNSGTTTNQQETSYFATDSEIAVAKDARDDRLVAAGSEWTSDGLSASNNRHDKVNGSIEEGGSRKNYFSTDLAGTNRSTIGDWDQFKANEDLFDVRATFDENLYTTALDKSQINRMELRKAERLAKEIESTTSSNIHVSEERGHIVEGDYDEEDKYSGVLAVDNETRSRGGSSENVVEAVPPSVMRKDQRKMNYAAVAKADSTAPKPLPPGFSAESNTDGSGPLLPPEKGDKTRTSADKTFHEQSGCLPANQSAMSERGERLGDEKETNLDSVGARVDTMDMSDDASNIKPASLKESESSASCSPEKSKSKLNANAKSFTFNPDAKTFTPGAGAGEVFVSPPNDDGGEMTGVVSQQHIQSQHQAQYLQLPAQMTHAGMMPMVTPRFAPAMRFQGVHPYQGIDQHTSALQQHQRVQQVQSSHPEDTGVPVSQTEDQLSTQQHLQQGQASLQQHLPVSYTPPAGAAYFGGGVAMHHGHGGPHQGGYQQQLMGGPQQIPVVSGKNAYHHRGFASPSHVHRSGGVPNVSQMHVSSGNPPYFMTRNINYPSGVYSGHGPVEDFVEPDYQSGAGGNGRGNRRHNRKNLRNSGGHTTPHTMYHDRDSKASEKPSPQNDGLRPVHVDGSEGSSAGDERDNERQS